MTSNYSNCTSCTHGCCINFDILKPPVITLSELNNLCEVHGSNLPDFKKWPDCFLYSPVIEGKSCPFLLETGCKIFDYRPIDCRLFPFCIEMRDKEIWLTFQPSFCEGGHLESWIESFIKENTANAIELAKTYSEQDLADYAALGDFLEPDKDPVIWVCKI